MRKRKLVYLLVLFGLLLAACGGAATDQAVEPTVESATEEPRSQQEESYDMVTLLPPDAIPSIDDPEFYDVERANQEYGPEETVIGLEVDGEARAYSTALLSSHEIVNDMIKGRPIAVTW